MNTTMRESGAPGQSGNRRHGQRLDEIAMALVLIMTGGLWLAPKAMFPEGTWLAGLGPRLRASEPRRRPRTR
jgi:hypothetical protein